MLIESILLDRDNKCFSSPSGSDKGHLIKGNQIKVAALLIEPELTKLLLILKLLDQLVDGRLLPGNKILEMRILRLHRAGGLQKPFLGLGIDISLYLGDSPTASDICLTYPLGLKVVNETLELVHVCNHIIRL